VLENQVVDPALTLLCVHGNPTWSYLWRDLIAGAPPTVRVIAIDQLDMGYSERTATTRRLAQRIEDLVALTDELDLTGPVVAVAHDWGGPISLGWAERHRDRMAGIVLMNTAVHQPAGSPAPALIRMVGARRILETACVTTPAFIRGTMALARPRLPRAVRDAYEAPYRSADRRAAIATFVEDIPLAADHPSFSSLERVAADLEQLADVPALLLWGPSDPIFSDLYLGDLAARLPRSEIHRFSGSGHLVPEDADVRHHQHRIENRRGLRSIGARPTMTSPSSRWGPVGRRRRSRLPSSMRISGGWRPGSPVLALPKGIGSRCWRRRASIWRCPSTPAGGWGRWWSSSTPAWGHAA
jgi:pimeloyl-ACP methyl ester carboxylesterase